MLILVGEEAAADEALNRLLDVSPELSSRFGARVSPLVLDVAEWRARAAAGDPFVSRVAEEAILIVGDPDVLPD